MRIDIKGDIISNDDKWIYIWLDYDGTCPRDVQSAVDKAVGEPLEVYINSPGGEIFAGSEIYEILRGYRGTVKIHIVGMAASAASVIACAGYSDIAPTAMVMVHNVSSGARGDYHTMDHSSEVLQKANRAIAAAYVAKTGKSESDILAMMDKETWMTAADAVEYGLVDAISQSSNRLVASGPGSLPPDVIAKLKDRVKNPAREEESREKAQAKLDLLRLKGERK